MFKSKKYWIWIILCGIIIGLIAGMVMRHRLEYINRPVPFAFYLKGGIDSAKAIDYVLEIRSQLERKNKELQSVLEKYDKLGIENLENELAERELKKTKFDRGEIQLNRRELIDLESEISNLKVIQNYLDDYGEADAYARIEEDCSAVIQLEKYCFDEIRKHVDTYVDVSVLRAQLENRGKELEALLAAEEADENQIKKLDKEIKSINEEIIKKEAKESGIAGYTLLMRREQALDALISENNIQFDPSYSSINDFTLKSGRVINSYFIIYIVGTIIVLILLSFAYNLIVKKIRVRRFRRLEFWRSRHFEKYDSFISIIVIYVILITFSIVAFWPLLNVFTISLRPDNNLFSTTLEIIPKDWTFDNYRHALFETNLLIWLKNSLIVSLSVALIGVIFSSSAGYAFSRFRFYGRRPGMIVLLVTQMFPAPMLLLPTYVILAKLGLKDQLTGLLIPYSALAIPFSVWLLKGYFDTIPRSLEESAYIDGCSLFNTFIKIVLPLAKPALAIAALFSFMAAWSEYVIARVIVSQADKMTLPVGLVYLQGEFATLWGVYSAAALITCIPVILLFIALSRFLVGGLTLGGLKE